MENSQKVRSWVENFHKIHLNLYIPSKIKWEKLGPNIVLTQQKTEVYSLERLGATYTRYSQGWEIIRNQKFLESLQSEQWDPIKYFSTTLANGPPSLGGSSVWNLMVQEKKKINSWKEVVTIKATRFLMILQEIPPVSKTWNCTQSF